MVNNYSCYSTQPNYNIGYPHYNVNTQPAYNTAYAVPNFTQPVYNVAYAVPNFTQTNSNTCCNNAQQPHSAGVNVNYFTIDASKLPPGSQFFSTAPFCSVTPQGQNTQNTQNNYSVNNTAEPVRNSYPGNYYTQNLNPPVQQTEKKRVTVLTDDYIKQLENYLNSEDESNRIAASFEVFERFAEDDSNYDDAALNALLNKMLQDPTCHQVKSNALAALQIGIAQGNQNTVKILKEMVEKGNNDGYNDATTASNLLLQLSCKKEIHNIPVSQSNTANRSIRR